MLARAGADLNARDSCGATPLHWAAARGREQAVVALLCAGANPTLTAQLGGGPRPAAFTPADAALAWHHRGIAAFLSEAALSRSVASLDLNTTSESEAAVRPKPWRLPLVRPSQPAQVGGKRAAEAVTSGVDESEIEAAKVSLAAEEAAARIQAAFRGHRRRKLHAIWGAAPPTTVAAARTHKRSTSSIDMANELLERERRAQQELQEEALAERAGGQQSLLSLHGRLLRLQAAVRARQAATHAGGTALLAELRRRRTVRPNAMRRADEAEEASGEDDEDEEEDDDDVQKLPLLRRGQPLEAPVVRAAVQGEDDDELVDDEARMLAATLRVQAIVRSHRARAQYLRLKRATLLQLGEHARKRASHHAAAASGVTDSDV